MKVAVIIDTWFPAVGGGQVNAWEISKRLAKKGILIDIITRNNGKDNLKYPKNVEVYKLGSKSNPYDYFSRIVFLIRSFFFIQSRPYDLVHAHAFLPGTVARLLMVLKGIPAVFTVHGTSIGTSLNNLFARWLEKFILTQILYSAQITVSLDFLKLKNVNQNGIYIPNGVDVKKFDMVKIRKFKQPTLIFVGRLHPQKNLKTLIFAMDDVREAIPNIRLLIVGQGGLKDELKKQTELLNLERNVKFLGQKTGKDLINLYKSCHLFILPSIYEGQPLTLIEAWAAKLPVIVTKTGDCQYLIKDGLNGYVIDSLASPQQVAAAVKKALKKKNLSSLGESGYTLVKQNYSWEQSAEQTLEVYKQVLNG